MSVPEPTISELITAASNAVRGAGDKAADFVRGSDYESLVGPSAIIWSRQAGRDTDLFDSINFNTASGDDLTQMALKRYGKVRILDTRGTGTASLSRPASGVAETVWKGTRIVLAGAPQKVYRVTANTSLAAGDVQAVLPIESELIGVTSQVDATAGITFGDQLRDTTWTVSRLQCAAGTKFEEASAFRARILKERFEARVGQSKALIETCKAAGASEVALFRSNYAGDAYDWGLNFCYVGDSGYSGSPELVKACTLALRRTRVAGDHLQVLPMTRTSLAITADVYLYDSPPLFDLAKMEATQNSSLTQYLNGSSGAFAFSLEGIKSALIRHTPEVEKVVLTTPTADAIIVDVHGKNFPATLSRYVLGTVKLRYLGP